MRLSLQKEFLLCLSFPVNCSLGETFWERQPVTDGRLATLGVDRQSKQSLYKPGQALRVPEVLRSQISRPSAHEGGKVVSPRHRPNLPPTPGNIPGTHVCCGTRWCSWLRHALQAGKSGGRFPLGSQGLLFNFRPHRDPGFDSAFNRN